MEAKVPKLLTVRELSGLTGLQLWRVYDLVRKGEAPPHMSVGRTIRFPADGVVRWIQQRTNSTNTVGHPQRGE